MEEEKCDNCKFKDSSAWMPPCFGCGYGYNNFESADPSGNNNAETCNLTCKQLATSVVMPNNHNRNSKDYLQSNVVKQTVAAQFLLADVMDSTKYDSIDCELYNRQRNKVRTIVSSENGLFWTTQNRLQSQKRVLFEIKIRKSTFSRRNLQKFLKNNLGNVESDIFREVNDDNSRRT